MKDADTLASKTEVGSWINRALLGVLYLINRLRSAFPGHKKGLLIIKVDSLGDLIVFSRPLRHLREGFKGYSIYLLASKEVAGLAGCSPYVNEIKVFDQPALEASRWLRFRLLAWLWWKNFDTAINAHYSRKIWTDRLMRYSLALRRVGFLRLDDDDGSLAVRRLYEKLYTELVKVEGPLQFEPEKNRLLLRQLGCDGYQSEVSFDFNIPADDERRALDFLVEQGLPIDEGQGKLVIAVPGARWSGRQWPVERYAYVLNCLAQRHSVSVLACGSPRERGLLEDMVGHLHCHYALNPGTLSLPELSAVIKRATLYVGNETGPLQIALALGVPSLYVLGGGHFGRFVPHSDYGIPIYQKMDCYYCGWNCIYSEVKCIRAIQADDVLGAAFDTLEGKFGWRPTERLSSRPAT